MNRTFVVLVASSLWVLPATFAVGCGSDDHDEPHEHGGGDGGDHDASGHHDEDVGKDSGATCANPSTLTYENFGRKFFADYCLSCHSSKVTGSARFGAPADHNFDTLAEIELLHKHIDQKAAAGPDSVNESMPKAGAKPSLEDRKKLGEWLACDVPE